MLERRTLRSTAVALLLALTAAGCTSLREIPRGEYTLHPDRKDVRVVTRDGLEYEFDFARLEGDTLVGYRSRDVEGRFEDFGVLRLPLEEVVRMASRQVDWRRTALVGGGVIVGGVAAGLASQARDKSGNTSSGGGKDPVDLGPPD